MHRYVDRDAATRLWAEDGGTPDAEPLLLVAPANQSGVAWPDALLTALGRRHRVLRYDHRDTGRSDVAEDPGGYGATDLAADALAVLDAFDVERAHVVGVALGGLLTQLLLLDHPERLRTAVLVCSTALRAPDDPPLPGPHPALLRLWTEAEDPRDDDAELDWRVEHWRLLHGTGSPFDPVAFRAIEERVIAHSGRSEAVTAHAYLDLDGLDRGAELAGVTVPTLVVEAPDDPVHPPPHSTHLAARIGRTGHPARLVRIPGMGHAVSAAVAEPLAAAILAHTR
ncbi:alpha/beta fold hydrolase [Pseudonocardia humida]|uniref:Alpha/beta hydrolase n=1 Tax=Pseudonocardia humida TaxID=2800819 RepID=A0ABT1ADD8_9PSEU|nr:alpha/beta hydrolase [Pseudonocardia humida]MCO1660971.1 alpha/beta hydrolase [Pseudonocardia humida]